MFDIVQNRRILFGPGKLEQLPSLLKGITEKPAFVLVFNERSQCAQELLSILNRAHVPYVLDASLRGEPSIEDVDRIAARAAGCGAVVALGGGSAMDTAKAVAMLVTNGGRTEQYQMEGRTALVPALPLIAVPTTAGTGSEATKVSVVYNPKNHLKKSFYSPWMIAETVILDPQMLVTLPREKTVSTGIDALSHAIESYVSLEATPYTEMFSLQAMRLIVKSLKICVEHPEDLAARADMMLASYFGGCALNAGIGLAHIIAQPLGGLIKIPHGVACAIYLPYAMEYNLAYSVDKYCDIARIFGASSENGVVLAEEGVRRVRDYLKILGAPESIAPYINDDFDVDAAADTVRAATGHIKVNPRPVTLEAIRSTIVRSMGQSRSHLSPER